MYGLIGKVKILPGRKQELIDILLENVDHPMPGCISYVVAEDPKDEDAIWITELWQSEQYHKASLDLKQVKQAITKGRPLISDFEYYIETQPVGGFGLNE